MGGKASAVGPEPGQFAEINEKHVTRGRPPSQAGAEPLGYPTHPRPALPAGGDEGQRKDPSPPEHALCKP